MSLSPSQQKVVDELKKGERLILSRYSMNIPAHCYWLGDPTLENPIKSVMALENKGILTRKKYSATDFEIILKEED